MSFGHLKISRKAYLPTSEGGHPWWNEKRVFSRWEAWLDLIQLAAYADRVRTVSGVDVTLERGEVLASIRFLAQRWKWSEKRVRTVIKQGIALDMIRAQRETQVGTVYLIVNYDTYQSGKTPRGTPKGTAGAQQGAQQGHTGGTNEKQEEQDTNTYDLSPSKRRRARPKPDDFDPDFEQAWSLYPQREGGNPKKPALKAWKARVSEGESADDLFKAAVNYARHAEAKKIVGTPFVLQGASFYGPNERWKEFVKPLRLANASERVLLQGEATIQKTRAMVEFEERMRKEAS